MTISLDHLLKASRLKFLYVETHSTSAGKFAGAKILVLIDLHVKLSHCLPATLPAEFWLMGMVGVLFLFSGPAKEAETVGFRFGAKGTHTSRTMMFEELSHVLEATAPSARRADYAAAIIDGNCLSKPTASTRRLSNQRLGELYGLDTTIPLFRVLRRLWDVGAEGRPLLSLLAALARDPLLAATCPAIVAMPANAELQRDKMKSALQAVVGDRLNDSTLEKVCRNTASTWAQSGHLEGRTFKKRRSVVSSPTAVTFAIYLAHAAGFRGAEIFYCGWLSVLDCDPSHARELALDAKRSGLIDLRIAGDVVEFNLARLDPYAGKA